MSWTAWRLQVSERSTVHNGSGSAHDCSSATKAEAMSTRALRPTFVERWYADTRRRVRGAAVSDLRSVRRAIRSQTFRRPRRAPQKDTTRPPRIQRYGRVVDEKWLAWRTRRRVAAAAVSAAAQDLYDQLVKQSLSPALRSLGFTGSGGRYSLRNEDCWVLVGFQKSAYSDGDEVRFTVNLLVATSRPGMRCAPRRLTCHDDLLLECATATKSLNPALETSCPIARIRGGGYTTALTSARWRRM
jgi:hypothetical protein